MQALSIHAASELLAYGLPLHPAHKLMRLKGELMFRHQKPELYHYEVIENVFNRVNIKRGVEPAYRQKDMGVLLILGATPDSMVAGKRAGFSRVIGVVDSEWSADMRAVTDVYNSHLRNAVGAAGAGVGGSSE